MFDIKFDNFLKVKVRLRSLGLSTHETGKCAMFLLATVINYKGC